MPRDQIGTAPALRAEAVAGSAVDAEHPAADLGGLRVGSERIGCLGKGAAHENSGQEPQSEHWETIQQNTAACALTDCGKPDSMVD